MNAENYFFIFVSPSLDLNEWFSMILNEWTPIREFQCVNLGESQWMNLSAWTSMREDRPQWSRPMKLVVCMNHRGSRPFPINLFPASYWNPLLWRIIPNCFVALALDNKRRCSESVWLKVFGLYYRVNDTLMADILIGDTLLIAEKCSRVAGWNSTKTFGNVIANGSDSINEW